MQSVYEVSEEEGGRNRIKDLQRFSLKFIDDSLTIRGKSKHEITLADGTVATNTTTLTEGNVFVEEAGNFIRIFDEFEKVGFGSLG